MNQENKMCNCERVKENEQIKMLMQVLGDTQAK